MIILRSRAPHFSHGVKWEKQNESLRGRLRNVSNFRGLFIILNGFWWSEFGQSGMSCWYTELSAEVTELTWQARALRFVFKWSFKLLCRNFQFMEKYSINSVQQPFCPPWMGKRIKAKMIGITHRRLKQQKNALFCLFSSPSLLEIDTIHSHPSPHRELEE